MSSIPLAGRRSVPAVPSALLFSAVALSVMPYLRLRGVFITISDVLFLLALLLATAKRTLYVPWGKGIVPWWFGGSSLVVAGLLMSSFVSREPLRGIIVAVQYGFVFWILPLSVASVAKLADAGWSQVARWFLRGMTAVQLWGLFVYATNTTFRELFMINGRMGSLLENPNNLGKMTGLTLPILIYLCSKRRIQPVEALVCFVAAVAGLAISSSFGGLITAFVAVLVFGTVMLLSGATRATLLRMGLAVCVIGALFWVGFGFHVVRVPATMEKRIIQPLTEGGSLGNLSDKLGLIEEAIDYISQSPIVGIGPDQYKNVSQFLIPVHNTYLLLWAEGGFLALIGILIIVCIPAGLGLRLMVKGHLPGAALALSVGAALFMACMTNTHIYARYWLLAAVIPLALATGDAKQSA